jgi:neutral ceramidase
MQPAKPSKTLLRAGAAMIDVTPPAGTHLGGTWGTLRRAETLADRLYARALVVEQGGRTLCYVTADLEIVTERWATLIRREIQTRCGIPMADCMVSLPQIHSVPPLGNFLLGDEMPNVPPEHEYLRGSQTPYCEMAAAAMIEAAVQAFRKMEPVEMAHGRALRDDLAFNRRGIRRDGTVCMPWLFSSQESPLGPTDILCLEGPMDPEVGVVTFTNQAHQIVACLLHYTCHPVNVFAQTAHVLSADWPGAWSSGVQAAVGAQCVPLVVNGCCGNINPWSAFDPDFHPDHRRMGRELTKTTQAILKTLKPVPVEGISAGVRILQMPLKAASDKDRRAAEAMLKTFPQPKWQEKNPKQVEWEWMDAALLISVEREREKSPDYSYEIQVFKIGPVALIGLPGEPFVEGQLAIKSDSPAALNLVAHCTNSYAGYIAPRAAYARGGHEIRDKPAQWAKVAPGGLERLVAATTALLKELP